MGHRLILKDPKGPTTVYSILIVLAISKGPLIYVFLGFSNWIKKQDGGDGEQSRGCYHLLCGLPTPHTSGYRITHFMLDLAFN